MSTKKCSHGRVISVCRCREPDEVVPVCPYGCEESERLRVRDRRKMLRMLSTENIDDLDSTVALALKLALRRDYELSELDKNKD